MKNKEVLIAMPLGHLTSGVKLPFMGLKEMGLEHMRGKVNKDRAVSEILENNRCIWDKQKKQFFYDKETVRQMIIHALISTDEK